MPTAKKPSFIPARVHARIQGRKKAFAVPPWLTEAAHGTRMRAFARPGLRRREEGAARETARFVSTKTGRENDVRRAGGRPLVCPVTGTPGAAYCTSMRFAHKSAKSEARRRIPRSAALLGRESTCALPDSSSLGILLWRLRLHAAVFVGAFAYRMIQGRSIAQLLAQNKANRGFRHKPSAHREFPVSPHMSVEACMMKRMGRTGASQSHPPFSRSISMQQPQEP